MLNKDLGNITNGTTVVPYASKLDWAGASETASTNTDWQRVSGIWHFEGNYATYSTQGLPSANVIVLSLIWAPSRGAAICIYWPNTGSSTDHPIYVNTLHNNWIGWRKI